MLNILRAQLEKYVRLSNREFNALADVLETRTCDKRVRIIETGEHEEYIHFIVEGLVRKFFVQKQEEIVIQIAREGELIFAGDSNFNNKTSENIIETLEQTTLLSLHKTNAEKLCNQYPVYNQLTRLVLTEILLRQEAENREFRVYNPEQRFIRFGENRPDMMMRVPQKILASYLNIKPETFSRFKHTTRGKKFKFRVGMKRQSR